MTYTLIEDRRDLFPLYVLRKITTHDTKRSSRFQSRRHHRELVNDAARGGAMTLNEMNKDDKIFEAT